MSCLKQTQNGVTVRVRLTPKAKREGTEGIYADPDGEEALKVAVGAPPADGRANKALIALLSKLWKIPKSSFKIIAGTTDRNKVLAIEGNGADLFERLCAEVEKCRK